MDKTDEQTKSTTKVFSLNPDDRTDTDTNSSGMFYYDDAMSDVNPNQLVDSARTMPVEHSLSPDDGINMDELENVKNLSAWQTFCFFVKHSKNDMFRRKFHFCLAFSTVLIVVLSTLIVNTIIGKGPIVFMKLAEQEAGQMDGVIYPRYEGAADMNSLDSGKYYLNYTKFEELLDKDVNG